MYNKNGNRRQALQTILAIMLGCTPIQAQERKLRRFRIRYRTKPKGSINRVTVTAYNETEAKAKLLKQHPEAEILSLDPIP